MALQVSSDMVTSRYHVTNHTIYKPEITKFWGGSLVPHLTMACHFVTHAHAHKSISIVPQLNCSDITSPLFGLFHFHLRSLSLTLHQKL